MNRATIWTADDVIAAIYELQRIDLANLSPEFLESQRPAASLLAAVTDCATIAEFLTWFREACPEFDRCDPKDARRMWWSWYLYRLRTRQVA